MSNSIGRSHSYQHDIQQQLDYQRDLEQQQRDLEQQQRDRDLADQQQNNGSDGPRKRRRYGRSASINSNASSDSMHSEGDNSKHFGYPSNFPSADPLTGKPAKSFYSQPSYGSHQTGNRFAFPYLRPPEITLHYLRSLGIKDPEGMYDVLKRTGEIEKREKRLDEGYANYQQQYDSTYKHAMEYYKPYLSGFGLFGGNLFGSHQNNRWTSTEVCDAVEAEFNKINLNPKYQALDYKQAMQKAMARVCRVYQIKTKKPLIMTDEALQELGHYLAINSLGKTGPILSIEVLNQFNFKEEKDVLSYDKAVKDIAISMLTQANQIAQTKNSTFKGKLANLAKRQRVSSHYAMLKPSKKTKYEPGEPVSSPNSEFNAKQRVADLEKAQANSNEPLNDEQLSKVLNDLIAQGLKQEQAQQIQQTYPQSSEDLNACLRQSLIQKINTVEKLTEEQQKAFQDNLQAMPTKVLLEKINEFELAQNMRPEE